MDISPSLTNAPVWLCIYSILVIGYTFWFYRHTVPVVSSRLKSLLIVLRSVALICIGLLIFELTFDLSRRQTNPASIAVLIDGSQSMEIKDNGRVRADILLDLRREKAYSNFLQQFDVNEYVFSDIIHPSSNNGLDSIQFLGRATDITGAIQSLLEQQQANPIKSILLLSDGSHNTGERPPFGLPAETPPVHTIIIGEKKLKPDLYISRIFTNEITYVDNELPVEVTVCGPGFEGRQVPLRLIQDGRIIDRAEVTLPPDGLEKTIQLRYVPKEDGFHSFSINLAALEGELTTTNNQREVSVRVMKSKMKILIVADAPSADLAFLKRLLIADRNVDLTVRTHRSGSRFYEGTIPSLNELLEFDLLFLLNCPSRRMPREFVSSLSDVLVQHNKPFFLMAGKNVDREALRMLNPVLPFSTPNRIQEIVVHAQITSSGRIHPVLVIEEETESNAHEWQRLPPIYTAWSITGLHPGCQVLIEGRPESVIPRNERSGFPLLLSRHVNREKSLVLMGTGLYRWDLLMWGTGDSNKVLKGFIQNAIRWLAAREEQKPVRGTTDKVVYRSGEKIILTAQVYDAMLQPISNADVTVRMISTDQELMRMNPEGDGKYRLNHRFFDAGLKHAEIEAVYRGQVVGKDTVDFSITSFNPEYLNTQANPELMQSIATHTSGRSGPPDSVAAILSSLQYEPETSVISHSILMYRWPWFLAFIVFILALEWFIRKRKGMV